MKQLLVLGGGQLARYLVHESHSLPLKVVTVSPNKNDPAASINPNHVVAKLTNKRVLSRLIKQSDLVTFESEFISADFLRSIAGKNKNKFFPSLNTLEVIQDRRTQKESLHQYKVPNLPFMLIQNIDELKAALSEIKPLVLKARTGGYDGYGTHIIKKITDLPKGIKLADYIAEPFMHFTRELAITVYRNKDGSKGHFPFVEWKAKDHKCYWIKGPIEDKSHQKMLKRLYNYMEKMSYVGVLSAEFFEDPFGDLYVNELAPRVHNSCHYSLNACSMSQFYLHLLAGLNEDLPKKIQAVTPGFAMVNLIGSGKKRADFCKNSENTWVYDYKKDVNKAGRKLGHINTLASSADKALSRGLKAEAKCQK